MLTVTATSTTAPSSVPIFMLRPLLALSWPAFASPLSVYSLSREF